MSWPEAIALSVATVAVLGIFGYLMYLTWRLELHWVPRALRDADAARDHWVRIGKDKPLAERQAAAHTQSDQAPTLWRVGTHYGIHVYEGDRPVATFHRAQDAEAAVDAHNRQPKHEGT